MGAFSRSWEITKLSFSVIKYDKELLAFPIISAIFSFAFIIAMIFPAIIAEGTTGLDYLVLFVVYLGLAFIATFFNVAVVYTAKTRFSGGNSKFVEALKFSLSKIHLIFFWALLSATVGLILKIIEDRAGSFAAIISRIIGFLWSVAIIFVVPSMVYDNKSPFAAIKQSIFVLKKTWGENIIKVIGLGFVQTLFFFAGIIFFGLLTFLMINTGFAVLIPIILAGIYFVLLFLVFSVANQIFNTALYVYANTGNVPSGFNSEVLNNAVQLKK